MRLFDHKIRGRNESCAGSSRSHPACNTFIDSNALVTCIPTGKWCICMHPEIESSRAPSSEAKSRLAIKQDVLPRGGKVCINSQAIAGARRGKGRLWQHYERKVLRTWPKMVARKGVICRCVCKLMCEPLATLLRFKVGALSRWRSRQRFFWLSTADFPRQRHFAIYQRQESYSKIFYDNIKWHTC